MAANELEIANKALLHLGQGRLLTSSDGTVANIVETDQPEAVALQHFFDDELLLLLRLWAWPWANKYATLTLEDNGDGEIWEDEWDNAFVYPADCARFLKFITARGRLEPNIPRHAIGWHNAKKVIFSDVREEDADCVYTELVTDTTRYSEEFDEALSQKLAYEIAPALSADPELRQAALQAYRIALVTSQSRELNEQMPELYPDDGTIVRSRLIAGTRWYG